MRTRPHALLAAIGLAVCSAPLTGSPAQTQAPAPSAVGVFTGRVLDTAGAPVASAIVSIGASSAAASPRTARPPNMDPTLTDAQGQFFFRDLAPGRYSLTGSKPGWLSGGFGRRRPGEPAVPIELGEGERRGNLTIPLWRPAIITGRVTDDAGDPLINAEVRAVRQIFVAGRAQNDTPVRLQTDDRGVYRFASLLPGDYLIAVLSSVLSEPAALAGAMSAVGDKEYLQTMAAIGTAAIVLDRATGAMRGNSRTLVGSLSLLPSLPADDGAWKVYPTTYHPGSMTRSGARLVRVAAGETRADVDVLVRLTESWQVSGTLMAPDGPAAWHGIHLVPAETDDMPLVDVSTAVTDQSGAFTFFGVPPGQYIARVVKIPWPAGQGARLGIAGGTGAIPYVTNFSQAPSDGVMPMPTEPLLHASTPVTVGGGPVRDLAITMRPGPRVTGRAVFEGSAAMPTASEWRAMTVDLQPANGRVDSMMNFGRFTEDGRFATPSLWPGRYLIRGFAPSRWTFKSATVAGREVGFAPIDITGDLENVVITFTDKIGEITGTVRDPNSATNLHATVLLFPDDAAGWVDYGRASRRVASASADATGRFTLTMPPDGGYCLVAIRDEDADNWRNPQVLAKLARAAERIQVKGDPSLTRNLQVVSIK